MLLSITLITIIVIAAIIWIFIEAKRFNHRIFALFLIGLIIFLYISFTLVLNGKNVDLSSLSGIQQAGGIYLSWLGSVFGNLKTLTANAIHLNWGTNNSTLNTTNLTYINLSG